MFVVVFNGLLVVLQTLSATVGGVEVPGDAGRVDELREVMTPEAGNAMLDGLGKCAPVGRNAWRPAQLSLRYYEPERLTVESRGEAGPGVGQYLRPLLRAYQASIVDVVAGRERGSLTRDDEPDTEFFSNEVCDAYTLVGVEPSDEAEVVVLVLHVGEVLYLVVVRNHSVVEPALESGVLAVPTAVDHVLPRVAWKDLVRPLVCRAHVPNPRLHGNLRERLGDGALAPAGREADEVPLLDPRPQPLDDPLVEELPVRQVLLVPDPQDVLRAGDADEVCLLLLRDARHQLVARGVVVLARVEDDPVAEGGHHVTELPQQVGEGAVRVRPNGLRMGERHDMEGEHGPPYATDEVLMREVKPAAGGACTTTSLGSLVVPSWSVE